MRWTTIAFPAKPGNAFPSNEELMGSKLKHGMRNKAGMK
jgi:hypothetical protein